MPQVRQAVYKRFVNDTRFFLRDLRGASTGGKHKALSQEEYLGVLRTSKFCLAPAGMGFSTRAPEAISQGCVPLLIQDGRSSDIKHEPNTSSVENFFGEVLDWPTFSLTLKQADIPALAETLENFPDAEWRAMRKRLACVWPRLLWLRRLEDDARLPAPPRPADLAVVTRLRGHDAFESLMRTLARRRGIPSPDPCAAPTPGCDADTCYTVLRK